ncbi:hypothetical protein, partial [Staphylococcus haemolyticus]|uniref:hypothetical protein n=1 Tax=Staphylococcus haemolyticus TaxID=1283 RepID=UPI001C5CAAFE
EAQKIESNQTQERALTKQNEASKKALTDLKRQIRAEQMLADMDELLALTVNYWTQPAETASTSAIMIKSKIKDLSHRCSSYRSFLWTSASTEFMNIKRTITGGSFEGKFRPALHTTSPLIQNASREIDNFKIKLRTYIDSIDELNNH